jgi:DNA-binding SARP family transcriptional activator
MARADAAGDTVRRWPERLVEGPRGIAEAVDSADQSAVAFRLLGQLEVLVGGQAVPISSAKHRALLATLLLRANVTVPLGELSEALWGDIEPANPRSTIQKYVMRTRRLLEPTGTVIHTDVGGYRIEVQPDQVDVHRFGELAERGRRAFESRDWGAASSLLTEAVGLWHAVPPLADVRSEIVQRDEVPRLVEGYLAAVEMRVEADLRLGRHGKLCEELLGLVRRHPLRERFWIQWMRVLHAAHRQGEALAAYREVARLLADELGVEPSRELQSLHQQILVGATVSGPVEAPSLVVVPGLRQLPMTTSGVVGRAAEIDEIVRALSPVPREGRPGLVIVNGPAGAGKSTVAVHAAHRLAGAFPDGQLYAEFGNAGKDSADRVMEVLGHFLRALGVPPDSVPSGLVDAVGAYRTATADRQLLVVLDGVSSARAARALLPGSASCRVLVTSRYELTDLFVAPGAHAVHVGVLREADGYRLLCEALGERRVEMERDAAEEMVRQCQGSPLALRLRAARLATQPGQSIASVLDAGPAVLKPAVVGELRAAAASRAVC